jgi:hypothetical protein
MSGKEAKRSDQVEFTPWESIPDDLKRLITPEQWAQSCIEGRRHYAEYQGRARKRPSSWTEPSMSLEDAERDPLAREFAKQMRDKGMTATTRSQYMMMVHGSLKPYGWDQDAEDGIPQKLQDPYWRAYRNKR